MAQIAENDTFTQLVLFEVDSEKQDALVNAAVAEVERWVSKRPGFISATFHASFDGKHVMNYAQWADEAAFNGFMQDPENETLQAALGSVDPLKPQAVQFRVIRSIAPSE